MRITLIYHPARHFLLWIVACSLAAAPASAQENLSPQNAAREVRALLDITAGEYALAVSDAGVDDSLEYGEARLLLELARELAFAALLDSGPAGERLAAALDSAESRMARIARPEALEAALEEARRALYDGWGTVALPLPERPLSIGRGGALYRVNCAPCHGSEGRGDGPDAPAEPPPSDFTDPLLVLESSPARMFQVLSYGIPGTEMDEWRSQLDERERWDLLAYVGRMGFSDAQRAEGKRLYAGYQTSFPRELREFRRLATLSGAELVERLGASASASGVPLSGPALEALAAYVRTSLERGAATDADPNRIVAQVRDQLARSIDLRDSGDYAAARRASIQAYLTFEGIERELRLWAPGLVASLESDFFAFRESLADPEADPRAAYARLDVGLSSAVDRLGAGRTLWSDFFSSLVIIVREGVEAILIVGALLAFLVRSGHAEQRSAIYLGVLAAVGASLVTALIVEIVLELAPAQQEVLEGVTMLVAVAVLFLVSYWLVSKIEVRRWQDYIHDRMSHALSARSQLALASVAFFAVFREGVETVLFYAALLSAASSAGMVAIGFVAGLAILALVYGGVYQFGMRIPLRPFFAVTSGILYFMAFVFAGKGIRELQEAGVVGVTRITSVPQIEILGLYPSFEGLVVQAILVGALVIALAWTFFLAPARRRAFAVE